MGAARGSVRSLVWCAAEAERRVRWHVVMLGCWGRVCHASGQKGGGLLRCRRSSRDMGSRWGFRCMSVAGKAVRSRWTESPTPNQWPQPLPDRPLTLFRLALSPRAINARRRDPKTLEIDIPRGYGASWARAFSAVAAPATINAGVRTGVRAVRDTSGAVDRALETANAIKVEQKLDVPRVRGRGPVKRSRPTPVDRLIQATRRR